MDLSMRAPISAPPPARRLIAVGTITRRGGRTTTVRATPAGVTGTIAPAPARAQDDRCPLCEMWRCVCPPWTGGQTTVVLTGGAR
ncbi:hypothetical protein [Streptomyces liangshanensis]|uniref:hypothetical protein n=1 Tax=Streptomyces liangshanensis TaxID=2717324 RepID=UPI0036DDA158